MLTLDQIEPQARTTHSKCPASDDTQQFETKSDGLPLPKKDDTVIYQLELKRDWHYEAKVAGRAGKAEGLYSNNSIVGLMLHQQLMTKNLALNLKKLSGKR